MLRAFLLACCSLLVSCSRATQPEVVTFDSKVLAGNPLGDRTQRRLAVFSPASSEHGDVLPMVIYLPGWGGSSENYIGGSGGFTALVESLAKDGLPLRIAVVDGRSRFGGSQFLNSEATGRYADFVADEIVSLLAKDYPTPAGRRWVAGHSSGAYGALRLAMDRPQVFSAVVALSPDSDFDVTHKPLVQQPDVQRLPLSEVAAAQAPRGGYRLPGGLAELVLGLCANYCPTGPGRFDWLYDAEHRWRADVWKRWLDADPLSIVKRKAEAFAPTQAVYLDGAEFDEFGANIGARKIFDVLRERKTPVTFYESPGHHADHLAERFGRGLRWVAQHGSTGR